MALRALENLRCGLGGWGSLAVKPPGYVPSVERELVRLRSPHFQVHAVSEFLTFVRPLRSGTTDPDLQAFLAIQAIDTLLVDVNALTLQQYTLNTVGIDISKAHLDAYALPARRTARFDNTANGIKRLAKWIATSVHCVVYESTGPWHRRLEETLADTLPMACVNAMRARRFAQAMGCKAKTDAVDAQGLAAMGAAMPLRRTPVRSPTRRDLQELHRARDALIKDRTAALHRQKHVRHALLKRQLHHRLAHSRRQLETLDQAIAKLADDDADLSRQSEVLASIPGIAQVTTPQPTLHGSLERHPPQSGPGPPIHPVARTRKTTKSGTDRHHAQTDRARQHLASPKLAVDTGPRKLKPLKTDPCIRHLRGHLRRGSLLTTWILRSATSRLSRAFSSRNCLSSRTSPGSKPPYCFFHR